MSAERPAAPLLSPFGFKTALSQRSLTAPPGHVGSSGCAARRTSGAWRTMCTPMRTHMRRSDTPPVAQRPSVRPAHTAERIDLPAVSHPRDTHARAHAPIHAHKHTYACARALPRGGVGVGRRALRRCAVRARPRQGFGFDARMSRTVGRNQSCPLVRRSHMRTLWRRAR